MQSVISITRGSVKPIDGQPDAEWVQHITFDFAQQIEVPHSTRQVRPIYFKVRYHVKCFGLCEEAAPHQSKLFIS